MSEHDLPSLYKMFWGGAWRPVVNMYEGRQETHNPCRASAAVLFVSTDEWIAVATQPGDILRSETPRPRDLPWEPV